MRDALRCSLLFLFLAVLVGICLRCGWAGLGAANESPPLDAFELELAPASSSTCGSAVGNVSDCCCTYADLEATNGQAVHSLLQRVVATPFFGHFRVNLCSECKLWHDNPMCTLRDCSVCECEDPPAWAVSGECDEQQIDQRVTAAVPMGPGLWATAADEAHRYEDAEVVVDLRENPERFTGYAGTSAAKVWNEVHNSNCFRPAGSARAEAIMEDVGLACSSEAVQRIYDRLISGLHASISLHIAHGYCLERSATQVAECARWGVNLSVARERVLEHPDRVENLYATFAVLLRAVVKAGDAVSAAVPQQDDMFSESLREWQENLLPELQQLAGSCPKTFAEEEFTPSQVMWHNLEMRLKHLADIMECVGCDRCKLWGTLQTQGLGVALRVLLQPGGVARLTRQEAVVLVHTLERLSSSLEYLKEFRAM